MCIRDRSNVSSFPLEKKIQGLVESSPIDFLKDHWKNNNKLIFLGSIGAVVRLISPFVRSKENDPAILVMDSKAKNVITLLGCLLYTSDAADDTPCVDK